MVKFEDIKQLLMSAAIGKPIKGVSVVYTTSTPSGFKLHMDNGLIFDIQIRHFTEMVTK